MQNSGIYQALYNKVNDYGVLKGDLRIEFGSEILN